MTIKIFIKLKFFQNIKKIKFNNLLIYVKHEPNEEIMFKNKINNFPLIPHHI